MRERENPLGEQESAHDRELREKAEREQQEIEMTRREFYWPYEKVPGQAPQRSDADIARDIETALFYNERVRSYEVKCDVHDGQVTCSGTVDDETTRRLVEDIVMGVPGCKGLVDNIQVRSSAQGKSEGQNLTS